MILFDDLAVGDTATLGPTCASRSDVMAFARTYDPQPFHLSDEAASRTYFKRLSASGWHTLTLVLGLIANSPQWPLACRGVAEIRDLRWRAPVYPDDPLTISMAVRACDQAPDADCGMVTLFAAVSNAGPHVVAEMTVVLAVARRAG